MNRHHIALLLALGLAGSSHAQQQYWYDADARRPLWAQSGLVASLPGEPALALANRLYETGEFAAASPNWWQPRQRK